MTHLHLADAVFLSDLFSYTNETVIKANKNVPVHKEHTNNIYYPVQQNLVKINQISPRLIKEVISILTQLRPTVSYLISLHYQDYQNFAEKKTVVHNLLDALLSLFIIYAF